ncbi:hypothetical protein SISNIDRAFT_489166 [Sistotremastrum niveocremeum HHB9708]|uniref:Uncharacterized protein n=1 Tax=Sistotremastrum niveocremeum HHB9708 TaxID=1314777 RepID=A0A164QAM2_9AGAM|nr:hypothetical protein SISNIDRAFT_489166 [Sistotremastrum niveocremeum HHB9708]
MLVPVGGMHTLLYCGRRWGLEVTNSEPKPSPKPEPSVSLSTLAPWLILFSVATASLLFILWRRASSLKYVVQHKLKDVSWPKRSGAIRLDEGDQGPPAETFLDDYDENEHELPRDEPLPAVAGADASNTSTASLEALEAFADSTGGDIRVLHKNDGPSPSPRGMS